MPLKVVKSVADRLQEKKDLSKELKNAKKEVVRLEKSLKDIEKDIAKLKDMAKLKKKNIRKQNGHTLFEINTLTGEISDMRFDNRELQVRKRQKTN